jgi:hypothetical protein
MHSRSSLSFSSEATSTGATASNGFGDFLVIRIGPVRQHGSRSLASTSLPELNRALPDSYLVAQPAQRLPVHLSFGFRGQKREVGKLLAALAALRDAHIPSWRAVEPVARALP